MAGREWADCDPPEWIDYNGHLRDAYYAVILSDVTDAFMDRIGLDARIGHDALHTLYA